MCVFCIAVDYPCGRLPPQETTNQSVVGQTRLVGANHCPKGECLWQVNTAAALRPVTCGGFVLWGAGDLTTNVSFSVVFISLVR